MHLCVNMHVLVRWEKVLEEGALGVKFEGEIGQIEEVPT